MAGTAAKRKASSMNEEPRKRQRVVPHQYTDNYALQAEDDECLQEIDDSFEEEVGVESPVTPFSPGRKKFPSELKTLKCSFKGCEKTFNRPIRLETHMKTHTNQRTFKCTYEGCDKAYFESKHLQSHAKGSHSKERNYPCDWEDCDKSFLTNTRLKRHRLVHEGHERFRCTAYPPCNKTFRKHQTLQRHVRSEHLELCPFPCTFIDPITLDLCKSGFDQAGGLRKHQERVHRAPGYFCTDCTIHGAFNPDGTPIFAGFITKNGLESHIRKEHANCPFCDLKCSGQPQLQSHIESQHSGRTLEQRKTNQCTYNGCGKTFTKNSNLTVHIKTVHLGERFICGNFDLSANPALAAFNFKSGCGKDFVSKATLEDHIRTAHLSLPSQINRNRRKAPSFNDNASDEGTAFSQPTKTKQKPSAIAELIGNSYEADQHRNIPCSMPGCEYKFFRTYDLQNHLRIVHRRRSASSFSATDATIRNTNSSEFSCAHMPASLVPEDLSTPGQVIPEQDTADLDATYERVADSWDFQATAPQDPPFWMGSDLPEPDVRWDPDTWIEDEAEMRRLIGNDFVIPHHLVPEGM